ncbi:hypothetical protein [Massilia sp. Bi118]|uniref:hypothetical protein n=1 Tax=Massilia sp. Bi118 TaxID=2822346 RepID=UPI001E4A2D98|nr:hypothetical protein [Massilia sp. Bi118]
MIAVFSLAASMTCSAQGAEKQKQSVLGKWKLTAALDGSQITSIDEREARQLVGKTIKISQESVQFGSRNCPPPDLDAERVEPRLYLREQAHASARKLGLPNPVTVVNLGCTIAFIKNRDRLVIHWDGWFFDAARQK